MTSVRDLLDDLRIDYREHGESPKVSEGWVGVAGPCPFCGHGPAYLGIHLGSARPSCWACGKHPLAAVLEACANLSRADARRLAAGLDTGTYRPAPHAGKLVLPHGLTDLTPAHRDYLARRGFDPDELTARWKLQGLGPHGGLDGADLRWRVFVPVHRGRDVVSWTTRSIRPDCPPDKRYHAAAVRQSAVPRGELLFGEQYARNGVVVVEGPFGVMAVGPGAVCTCGTGYSPAQVARIARYPVRAVCFDSEPAAQRRAAALCADLAVYPGETFNVQLSGPDPDTSPKSELAELRSRFLE